MSSDRTFAIIAIITSYYFQFFMQIKQTVYRPDIV